MIPILDRFERSLIFYKFCAGGKKAKLKYSRTIIAKKENAIHDEKKLFVPKARNETIKGKINKKQKNSNRAQIKLLNNYDE